MYEPKSRTPSSPGTSSFRSDATFSPSRGPDGAAGPSGGGRGGACRERAEDLVRRVGAAVRRARVERRLTQEDLAERAGLSVQHVQRIESPRCRLRDLKVSSLVRLAAALGTPRSAAVEVLVALFGRSSGPARKDRG